MKYICLGYLDTTAWEAMPASEREATLDDCFDYDDELRLHGHFAGGEALRPARDAVTLRRHRGEISVADGPYAKTKEQLGGILVLEARDLNHAIALMARHPGLRLGPFEIRPVADLEAWLDASRQRRGRRIG